MTRVKILLLATTLLAASGCAENSAVTGSSSTSIRTDIFEEVTKSEPVPAAFTDLGIVATLKTHKPGSHYMKDSHGTPEYRLLLNIDGQAVELTGVTQAENSESRALRDPEAGDGIRYRFTKKLRLKAGTHKIVAAIPADEVAIEREIVLAEGSNNLALEPVYGSSPRNQSPGFRGATSYKEGIRGFSWALNGEPL